MKQRGLLIAVCLLARYHKKQLGCWTEDSPWDIEIILLANIVLFFFFFF